MATDDWCRFQGALPTAACSVIWMDWLDDVLALRRLADLKARRPLQPVVLVTRRDADNVRHLAGIQLDGIVWPEEVRDVLWPTVGMACARAPLRRLAAAFESAGHLPRPFRQLLACACRDESRRSVADLACALGCDRRTLWRHWHEAGQAVAALRLEDFLHWLLLLDAAGRKVPSRGWSAIAAELDVHEHTLARLAKRLGGVTLHELGVVGQQTLMRPFIRQVVRPLLRDGDRDILG